MDEDTITDLKQFIAATVSQTVSQHTTELRREMHEGFAAVDARFTAVDARFVSIEQKIDDLSASVAEALDTSNESIESNLKDHERRITRLETVPHNKRCLL